MLIAALSSQYKERGLFSNIPNSIMFLSHKSSQTPSSISLCYAYALDLTTTVLFLTAQNDQIPSYECAIT